MALAFALALASVACEALIGAEFDRGARPSDPAEAGADVGGRSPFEVVHGLPAGDALTAIWGANERTIFAVGTNGLHRDYYGGTWHERRGVKGRDLFAVWGSSDSDVYAVGADESGQRGVIQHFDGVSWRDEYLADTPLYGVWGAAGVVLAVGARGMIYGKESGGAWASRLAKGLPPNRNVKVSRDSPVLWSISGNGPGNFAMAADLDRVFHYTDGAFVSLDPAVDRTVVFRSAFGLPSASTSIFFGSNYFGVTWLASPELAPAERFDAGAWDGQLLRLHEDRSKPGSDQRYVRGIWGEASTMVFVGDEGRVLSYDLGSNELGEVASPTDSTLYGVWGSSLADVWIVGERELILHGALTRE